MADDGNQTGNPPTVPPPVPPVPAPAGEPIGITAAQLKQRLDETRLSGKNELLKELGFSSLEDASKALKTLKSIQEGQLSETDRLKKQLAELEPAANRAKDLESHLSTLVKDALAQMPESAQLAIKANAGDDVEAQLKLIQFLRASGVNASPAGTSPPGTPAATPPSPPAPPAKTAPPTAPPRPAGAQNAWDKYQDIVKQYGQAAGDIHYQLHSAAIDRDKPATPAAA